MIFRAAVGIGLVWLLVPHEPDIGLGRPEVRSQLNRLAAYVLPLPHFLDRVPPAGDIEKPRYVIRRLSSESGPTSNIALSPDLDSLRALEKDSGQPRSNSCSAE